MPPTLRAGVGRAVITPPIGIAHAGWGVQTHQRAEGVDMDLLATVLVLANGPVEAALVDVDFCVVGRDLADPIRQAVADLCGIPFAHVRLSYTHTHSGPMLGPSWMTEGEELIGPYVASLAGRIAGAAWDAKRRLRPARVTAGSGSSDIVVNRRLQAPDRPGRRRPELGRLRRPRGEGRADRRRRRARRSPCSSTTAATRRSWARRTD